VFALRLNAFESFAVASDVNDGVNMNVDNTWFEQLGVDPTVQTTGNWLIAAGTTIDDNDKRAQSRIQLNASNITDVTGGWQHNANDLVPNTVADFRSMTAGAAADIDYDTKTTNGTAAQAEDAWLVAFSMELAPEPSIYILSEDYEGSSPYDLNNGNSNVSVTGGVADPAAGVHSLVASVDFSAGAGTGGEVRASPQQNLLMPEGQLGEEFTFSIDYYIPSTTRAGTGDDLRLLLRFNDGDPDDDRVQRTSTAVDLPSVTKDTWHTLTYKAIIPSVEADSDPITHVLPIISWRDQDPDVSGAGIDAYFDNVNVIVPEPSTFLLAAVGLLAMLAFGWRRSEPRQLKTVPVPKTTTENQQTLNR